MIHASLWIGGEQQRAASGASFTVTSPWDDAMLGLAERATATDVDRAVAAATRAAPAWRGLRPAERERLLLDAAGLVERLGPSRLLELLVDESGSTITKARGEIVYAADLLRAAAGEARRLYGDTLPNDAANRLSFVLREPLGVVAVIAPFNSPIALLTKMLAFPLAAGNAIVVKPSERTSLVAAELVRLLHEAGAPPGLINLITGFAAECGAPLVAHPGVHGIAFTGSTAAGRAIGAVAAGRMARVQLELGGKNPVLVLRDADPARAAGIISAGAYAHAGQICMAGSRVIVERARAAELVAELATRAKELHLGDRRDPRTAYGPLIDDAAVRKVCAQLDGALAGGATLVTGGELVAPRVLTPAVVLEPARDGALWREETFGPVVSVVAVDGLDEAIAAANDSDYGLSAAVLSSDLGRAFEAARRLRAGAVHIGMHPFQTSALAPIGGLGASGIGRSGGKYSTAHFTELKWISVELERDAYPRSP